MAKQLRPLSPLAKRRLRKLVKAVRENVPDKAFNMNHYALGPLKGDPKTCGTSACMAGWATSFLPETGLVLTDDGFGFVPQDGPGATPEPSLGRAFDITLTQVNELFYSYMSLSRMDTCDRFDRFIKSDGQREVRP